MEENKENKKIKKKDIENARPMLDALLDFIIRAFKNIRKPVNVITGYLIYATARQRHGISKGTITANIIAENANYGINIGQMPDGTENVVNEFVCNVVDKVIDGLKYDGMIECTIPIGSVFVQANGANAGGPVVAVGSNINNAKGYGVIR